MKRIIKVLAASALMVVLMATTVSPAHAWAWGYYKDKYGDEREKIGYGSNGQNNGCKLYADQGWHEGDRRC